MGLQRLETYSGHINIDVKVIAEALTAREEQLLLSQWARIPLKKLPITHAAHTWLHEKLDLPRVGSPDCLESPHQPIGRYGVQSVFCSLAVAH